MSVKILTMPSYSVRPGGREGGDGVRLGRRDVRARKPVRLARDGGADGVGVDRALQVLCGVVAGGLEDDGLVDIGWQPP